MNLKSFLIRFTHFDLLSFCYSAVKINVILTSTNTGALVSLGKEERKVKNKNRRKMRQEIQ
jgi:hypothetical protein